MAPSPPITETVFLHKKHGIDVVNDKGNDIVQSFARLVETLQAQKGYIDQHWGYGVESPDVFVWVIRWENREHHTAYTKSAAYGPFLKGVSELFDVEKGAPVQTFTELNFEEATAVFRAPATEVAYFTLPEGGQVAKDAIDKGMQPTSHYVKTHGKAVGGAAAWVLDMVPPNEGVLPPQGGLLYGVYGYASIEVHMKWRDMPEHGQVIEAFSELHKEGISLDCAALPGIPPDVGWFHVHFRSAV